MRTSCRVAMVAALGLFVVAESASAAEVSLISGVYRSESDKVAGDDAGGQSEISAGGRFSDQMDSHMFWFGQGQLAMRSYDKGKADDGPSDSTSLSLGGGVRYYFTKLAETVSPFAYGLGEFRSNKTASQTGSDFTENEENGLYYGGYFGIRLSLGTDFFVDFETPLFDSALFGTETSERTSYDATGKKTTSKDEKKKTELYVGSTGALNSMQVALGMRL